MSALGIDNYVNTREKVCAQFQDMIEKFKMRMSDFADIESNNMIFTEDLKHVIHLVDAKPDELNLAKHMMVK